MAAQFLRAALKPEFRVAAAKRQESTLKLRYWQDGKVTDTRLRAGMPGAADPGRAPDLLGDAQALAAIALRRCNCQHEQRQRYAARP